MSLAELAVATSTLIQLSTGAGISREALRLREIQMQVRGDNSPSVSLSAHLNETGTALEELYEHVSIADWDGYGARPVQPETYDVAAEFLWLLPTTVSPPEVSAEPDGEISFEWYKDPWHVFSVSLGSDRRLSYAGLFGRGSTTHGTEYLVDELPEPIMANLRRLVAD